MADQVYMAVDVTPPTLKVDLMPVFLHSMPLSLSEIELFRGDDASVNFTITSGGLPFNLTPYTVKLQAKHAYGDTSFVFDKTCVITNAAAGLCRADLTGSDLATVQSLQAQLYLTSNGTTQTAMRFPLTILDSV